jgi:hypothetical protein
MPHWAVKERGEISIKSNLVMRASLISVNWYQENWELPRVEEPVYPG